MSATTARAPGLLAAVGSVLRGPVPEAYRGRLAFAWTVLLLFLVQVGTGILLSFYYQASSAAVTGSVQYIMRDVQWGWLMRGVHHWASQALIVLLLGRLCVVLVAGGYRGVRATGWFVGLALLWLFVLAGFSGELLTWDNGAYWRTHGLLARVELLPLVGHGLATILRGGADISTMTLSRIYSMHSLLVPWLIWMLLVLNLWFLARRIQHETRPDRPGDDAEVQP